jgi:hypothetical protein
MTFSTSAFIPYMERKSGTLARPGVPDFTDWVNGSVVP